MSKVLNVFVDMDDRTRKKTDYKASQIRRKENRETLTDSEDILKAKEVIETMIKVLNVFVPMGDRTSIKTDAKRTIIKRKKDIENLTVTGHIEGQRSKGNSEKHV